MWDQGAAYEEEKEANIPLTLHDPRAMLPWLLHCSFHLDIFKFEAGSYAHFQLGEIC